MHQTHSLKYLQQCCQQIMKPSNNLPLQKKTYKKIRELQHTPSVPTGGIHDSALQEMLLIYIVTIYNHIM
jgi:hypothetical protein